MVLMVATDMRLINILTPFDPIWILLLIYLGYLGPIYDLTGVPGGFSAGSFLQFLHLLRYNLVLRHLLFVAVVFAIAEQSVYKNLAFLIYSVVISLLPLTLVFEPVMQLLKVGFFIIVLFRPIMLSLTQKAVDLLFRRSVYLHFLLIL